MQDIPEFTKKLIVDAYLDWVKTKDIAKEFDLKQVDVLNYLKSIKKELIYKRPRQVKTLEHEEITHTEGKVNCFVCDDVFFADVEHKKKYGSTCLLCVDKDLDYYEKLLNFNYFE